MLASATYTLDAASIPTQKTTLAGNETYTLDALNRLTNVTYPDSTSTSYTYDAVGNRSTMTTAAGTTNYGDDGADRLTSVTPPGQGAFTNTFDANDSQTGRGSDTFTYDYENRITSMTVAGTTSSMTYNGDGVRETRTTGGTTTNFVWDAAAGVVLDDGTQYVYGVGLMAHVVGNGTLYYLTDGLGSTMAIVDATGTVGATYTYDAYGTVKSSTGTQGSEYQFAGQDTDPSGLQYLRARYYDPSTGRFLSCDPSPGCLFDPAGHQPYVYASDNPASRSDPSGLMDLSDIDWSAFTPKKKGIAPNNGLKYEEPYGFTRAEPNSFPGSEGKPKWQFPNVVPGVDNWPGAQLNAILAQLRNAGTTSSSNTTTMPSTGSDHAATANDRTGSGGDGCVGVCNPGTSGPPCDFSCLVQIVQNHAPALLTSEAFLAVTFACADSPLPFGAMTPACLAAALNFVKIAQLTSPGLVTNGS